MNLVSSSYLCKYGLNINGQISVWTSVSTYNAKAQAIRSSIQSDGFVLRRPITNTLKLFHYSAHCNNRWVKHA